MLVSRASTQPWLRGTQGSSPARTISSSRNLSLQPEAARVNRRLGDRFKWPGGVESSLAGTLTLAASQQPVHIIRRQTASGESVEVLLGARRLTWSESEGVKATTGTATDPERLLVERLILDSADQFVFAQLRGASYFTIARNLRPNDAGENYRGPLWRLVRISEPQGPDALTPKSRWRLFYLNETTELIERVVSELDGQTIEATLEWTERDGQQFPSHIRWTANGQELMKFAVASFSQKN